MGAQSEFYVYDLKCTEEEIKEIYEKAIENAYYLHGHAGYSGTIAESRMLQFSDQQFDTRQQAEDFISDCGVFRPKSFIDQLSSKNVTTAVRTKEGWVMGGHYSW